MEKYPDQDTALELVQHVEQWEHWAAFHGTKFSILIERNLQGDNGYEWWVVDLGNYEGGEHDKIVYDKRPARPHDDALAEAKQAIRA